jgi:hypothetical protein
MTKKKANKVSKKAWKLNVKEFRYAACMMNAGAAD